MLSVIGIMFLFCFVLFCFVLFCFFGAADKDLIREKTIAVKTQLIGIFE